MDIRGYPWISISMSISSAVRPPSPSRQRYGGERSLADTVIQPSTHQRRGAETISAPGRGATSQKAARNSQAQPAGSKVATVNVLVTQTPTNKGLLPSIEDDWNQQLWNRTLLIQKGSTI